MGIEPIDFGIGDPSTPTPPSIRRAASEALERHQATGYPSFSGSESFRQAAADWIQRRFSVSVDPATQVTSSVGSKEMVFHTHLGYVDPGDVVVSPSPGYPPYERGTVYAGGEPFLYPVTLSGPSLPDLSTIPDEILARTRMVWITNPHSPTGRVTPLDDLKRLADACRSRNLLLLSDEAYSEIYFGDPPPSILQTGTEGVLAVFSMSKRSAMTGYRIGYGAGDPEAIRILRLVKMSLDSGTPNFIQDAAIHALGDEAHVEALREEYRVKREVLCRAMAEIGLEDCRPEAAMYLWQKAPDGWSGLDFAKALLREEIAVVATPGEWISSPLPDGTNPGAGFVRLALVPPLEKVEEAARRIKSGGLGGTSLG